MQAGERANEATEGTWPPSLPECGNRGRGLRALDYSLNEGVSCSLLPLDFSELEQKRDTSIFKSSLHTEPVLDGFHIRTRQVEVPSKDVPYKIGVINTHCFKILRNGTWEAAYCGS